LSESDRNAIENSAHKVKDGKTNYFQLEKGGLTAVHNVNIKKVDNQRIRLTWDTAYAGNNPIECYEIRRNNEKAGVVKHTPQTTKKPFEFDDTIESANKLRYMVVTVDKQGNRAETDSISVL